MPAPPPLSLTQCFDPELTAFFVGVLDDSYAAVSDRHDPRIGLNNSTFGFNLFHVVKHHVLEARPTLQKRIKVVPKGRAFRLMIDDRWEVALHRVGESAADDIWSSFPSTDSEAVKDLITQPMLPFPKKPERMYKDAKTAVIAHLGNYKDHLCAVYVCIPTSSGDDDKINEWGAVHPLELRPERGLYATDPSAPAPTGPTDSTLPTEVAPESGEPLAPVEKIDDVELDLKMKPAKKRDDRS